MSPRTRRGDGALLGTILPGPSLAAGSSASSGTILVDAFSAILEDALGR